MRTDTHLPVLQTGTQRKSQPQAGLNHGPNGIRRRLNATDRHVKAADYVGQPSRRYRRHAAER
jgi:hypothetical protein